MEKLIALCGSMSRYDNTSVLLKIVKLNVTYLAHKDRRSIAKNHLAQILLFVTKQAIILQMSLQYSCHDMWIIVTPPKQNFHNRPTLILQLFVQWVRVPY